MNGNIFASKKERKIDIVICIDATSSMGPGIENVKRNALNFHKDFVDMMTNQFNSEVAAVRVQIITFRDLESDTQGLVQSEFFELPEDNVLFERYVSGIKASGGGDYKESGLEALYAAMTTKWKAKSANDRQVIILMTDADAIGFGEKENRPGYGKTVEESQMLNTWKGLLGNANTIQPRNKRMVLFAPAGSLYDTKIKGLFDRCQFSPVEPQKGMADVNFDALMKILCASASAI